MYGGVRKRGTILGICMLFFFVYLLIFFVHTSRMKILNSFPQNESTIKSYGFYKTYFYAFESKQVLYLKECDEKNSDFFRLRYAKLPRYKSFFWKIPSIMVLILITIMTVTGVVKSATHLNGKLAWFLFDLYHTPIVAEDINAKKEPTEGDTIIEIPVEIFPESNTKENAIIILELDKLTEADLPVFSENKEINQKYFDAIIALETKGILPDGKYAYQGNPEDFNRMKELAYPNKFAVYDYVGDLEDDKELIIKVEGTCMADSADYIFHYNKEHQSFECIYDGFYGGDFYNAGIIYTPFSHGDMYQDDFWPHDVYSYDLSLGAFRLLGSTGEIDFEFYPEREAEYQQYDLDGDKRVYYFYSDNETRYMDHDDFYQWESELLKSGKIEVDWYECKGADLVGNTEAINIPTKEEVLSMRELALVDMTDVGYFE